ncbi:MAG TPA: DNA topoisomerase [Phycisphaerales bacterium]|nr:DNA topoisomerase [Phycisphaerales bacterium]HMP37748.1 DNA topoisomerase [Phycisphaerales bacterium]
MATRKPPASSTSRGTSPSAAAGSTSGAASSGNGARGSASAGAASRRAATKKAPPKRAASPKAPSGSAARGPGARHLVIVESPAKAKTINKFLGPDFTVLASVGHVRDLPERAPKGSKQPVPGVDLEHRFAPTYEVLPDKKKTMSELRKAAKAAEDVWFATDLDREGEAIAWHLAEELGIPAESAKRVIFNAITRAEILRAFEQPHAIDLYKVNAQQARRILDRIVGYQVSPLLWRKVARGLSAGRVQSVAVRLIVEREREIAAFVPEEFWRVPVRLTPKLEEAAALARAWEEFVGSGRSESPGRGAPSGAIDGAADARSEDGQPDAAAPDDSPSRADAGPSQKAQSAWIAQRGAIEAELVELDGTRFDLRRSEGSPNDALDSRVRQVAEAVGLVDVRFAVTDDDRAKGPARRRIAVAGRLDPATRYRVGSVETRRTLARPTAPFITSSLQVAASTALGFGADRTMRVAQRLYEGVELRGQGAVGLITYMRTDSTHLSGEAIRDARTFIERSYGARYLPEKPNFYGSSNKQAQEAHEAIRPTDAARTPESLRGLLGEDEWKLYRLIWGRFVACQMTPAEWDATTIRFERSDRPTGAVLRAGGRVLVFDGWYRAAGAPASADDPTLPPTKEGDLAAPFSIEPQQRFTQPPPRYSEASLVKKLEEEGIGRPSTYASIIRVIQDRGYVEQVGRRFHASDLGTVVTDKLIEGFPQLMDVGYTRELELELDKIEEAHTDWTEMLSRFYGPFSDALDHAMENMSHAKAEIEPAPYACPKCGRRTAYRFGRNGRFLSCSGYPECDYAAPIDREGRPILPESVDLICPEDGSAMILRTGRFGPFVASVNYPQVRFVVNVDRKGALKLPSPPPLVVEELRCEKCQKPMNLRPGKRGPWLGCSGFPKCRGRMAWTKLDDAARARLEKALAAHEQAHPQVVLRRRDGSIVPDGTPIAGLVLPGGVQELAIHADADAAMSKA